MNIRDREREEAAEALLLAAKKLVSIQSFQRFWFRVMATPNDKRVGATAVACVKDYNVAKDIADAGNRVEADVEERFKVVYSVAKPPPKGWQSW